MKTETRKKEKNETKFFSAVIWKRVYY